MTTPAPQLLFICRHSAWTSQAAACLETTLTAGVFEQQPALILLDDAVTLLLPDQQGEVIRKKSLSRQLPVLELYGIHTVYVDAVALAVRGLMNSELLVPVVYLQPAQLSQLLAAAHTTLVF
jgi:sulfur relay protein TusC/DsrF